MIPKIHVEKFQAIDPATEVYARASEYYSVKSWKKHKDIFFINY